MIRTFQQPDSLKSVNHVSQGLITPERTALNLIRKLCQALAEAEIAYCHWKSNNAIDRSASGENDLDLLISRADASRFAEILFRLGFKQASAQPEKQMPGVVDYFGYEPEADAWVHVHAHYQLILGHDMSKNFRLPIEKPFIESAVYDGLFNIPAPEFEYIVLVIRMILKHSTWDAILGREGSLKKVEREELAYLQARINQVRLEEILGQHLPYIDVALFNDCLQALQPGCSIGKRIKIGQRLQARLRTNGRRLLTADVSTKLWHRVVLAIRSRIFKAKPKYRLDAGGAMIAIVGGDGAGKTTAVDALYDWLSKHLATSRVHMGKPAWSWTTRSVRALLKIPQLVGFYPLEATFAETLTQKSPVSPGYAWLLREVCRARDRYWTYVKARRFAANGGLVIVDRYSLSQVRLMDGPLAELFISQLTAGPQGKLFLSPRKEHRLTQLLIKLEKSYYQQTAVPELLIVLRVHPDIAVQRKTDEDPASVRKRSTEIWELDWEEIDAHIIEASKSKEEVLAEIKALIWSEL